MNKSKSFITVFTLAYLFTLTMLFILQISAIPWFFFWLVLMHGGIVMLAVSKRKFKSLNVLPYYRRAYLSFALFIPILIYKIIVAIFSLEENEEIVMIAAFAIIGVCLLLAIYNVVVFLKKNQLK